MKSASKFVGQDRVSSYCGGGYVRRGRRTCRLGWNFVLVAQRQKARRHVAFQATEPPLQQRACPTNNTLHFSLRNPSDDAHAARDERRPAGLVARAEAASGVAVEVFVKLHEIAPVRIVCESRIIAKTRAASVFVRQKNARKPARKFER